jgi:hypothetical protein
MRALLSLRQAVEGNGPYHNAGSSAVGAVAPNRLLVSRHA